jgi:hypothetical protein
LINNKNTPENPRTLYHQHGPKKLESFQGKINWESK